VPLRRRLQALINPRKIVRSVRKPFFRGSVPWEGLDSGIVDRVKLLHGMGYQPFASGEGTKTDLGGGFVLSTPAWVHIEDTNAAGVFQRLIEVGDKPEQVARVIDADGGYVRVVWKN